MSKARLPVTRTRLKSKRCSHPPAAVVVVVFELLVHRFQEHLIGYRANVQTRFVEYGDDALVRLLDQVADDAVVEVVDVLPSDALAQVFLLFLRQIKICTAAILRTDAEDSTVLLGNESSSLKNTSLARFGNTLVCKRAYFGNETNFRNDVVAMLVQPERQVRKASHCGSKQL